MKRCKKCSADKPFSEYKFRKDVGRLYARCNDCLAQGRAAYYQKHHAEIRTKTRKLNAENPEPNRARVRRWAEANKERVYRNVAEYNRRYPNKFIARWKLQNAVQSGRIKKSPCVKCGRPPDRHVHGHHHNGYDQAHWFDVVWLCRWCHEKEHHQEVANVL